MSPSKAIARLASVPSPAAAPSAIACLALLALPGAVGAQARPLPDSLPRRAGADSAALSVDSLAARLARAEAAIALLREQLANEAESAVKTRSRFRLDLTARVITNVFTTVGRVNSHDVPIFVLARADTAAAAVGRGATGLTVRQSRIGAAMVVRDVLGGEFSGDVDLDFFGGVSNGPGDRRLFPEPRLRVTRAILRWDRSFVLVGSETPLVSDLNPVSAAAVGVPNFVAAGNLWNWLPQVRAGRDLGTTRVGGHAVTLGVQGAVLEPFTGVLPVGEVDAGDAGNRSRRPFLEGRLSLRTEGTEDAGDAEIARGAEIGLGVHRGWVRTTANRLDASRALTADWRFPLSRWAELRGEAYTGRLVRGLGGGGVAGSFGRPAPGTTVGPPIRDVAAWTQLNVQPHVTLIAGAGCGWDRADPDDRPTRRENTVCAAHTLWHPVQPVVLGLEFRWLRTRYEAGPELARHLNLALGFEL